MAKDISCTRDTRRLCSAAIRSNQVPHLHRRRHRPRCRAPPAAPPGTSRERESRFLHVFSNEGLVQRDHRRREKKCALPVSSPSLRDHRQMRPYGDDVRMSEAGPERLPTARGAATRPYGFMVPTTRSFGSSPRLECGRALRRRSNRSENSRFRIFSSSDPVWLAY